ncbi:anti-sigma factor family protein [Streptomyces sp. NPDC016845]|uniref:anti-sigma factor family protein n=1 Tax=Streptomyces sp. NPDC016845 TaxID=3364972 RepID=UPI00379082BF
MTSTTDTTDTAEHPEVAEISDLAEGLLPASRTADLRRHLDGCVLCADVYASLEEIRGLLGAPLPGPSRMPDDVAGRIDAALAAEALLDSLNPELQPEAADADAATETETETVEEAHDTTDDPVSRETSTASASRSTNRPSGHARAAAGPGRKPRTRRRRTGAALSAVLTVAALGVGALLLQNGDGTPTAKESGPANTFADGSLDAKVSELLGTSSKSTEPLATKAPSFGTQESSPQSPKSLPMPKRAATVPACVQLGTHRNEDPLAVDKGTYEGKSAYLVVLPHKTDPAHRVTAFIVDSSCLKDASPEGELLYTHDYDRG